ncbi:diguanylate cyclase [Vibrio sp. S234-5]|nr:diguanylate cyclase [Vibrio sp. S234-5]
MKFVLFAQVVLCFNTLAAEEDSVKKKLRVANSTSWKPFSYVAEDGSKRGILIDLWQRYGEKNGVEIEFVLADWNDSILAVREGRADVHAGLLWSDKRDTFFDFADAIMTINTQLYLSQRIITSDLNEMLTGQNAQGIGVVEGGYEEYFMVKTYPAARLVKYTNNRLMIEAAFRHDIDAFVADLQVANFYLYTSDQSTAFVPALYLYSGEIRPAVAEGKQNLLQELERGFERVGDREMDKVIASWSTIQTVYPKFLFPAALALVVVLSFSYILLLKRTVKLRTQELQTANQNLLDISRRDHLTQISNRRFFIEQLETLSTKDTSVAVLMFDIDDFKKINDEFGHATGDVVIQRVARCVEHELPDNALYARIGGEEFAIVLCGLPFANVEQLTKRLCVAVSDITFIQMPDKVTISLGCAYYPYVRQRMDLNTADNLMYQAKRQGKNCAAVAQIEL